MPDMDIDFMFCTVTSPLCPKLAQVIVGTVTKDVKDLLRKM